MSDWYERHGRWLWSGAVVIGVLYGIVGLVNHRYTTVVVGACLALNGALAARAWKHRDQSGARAASRTSRAIGIGLVLVGAGLVVMVLVVALTA